MEWYTRDEISIGERDRQNVATPAEAAHDLGIELDAYLASDEEAA